MDERFDVALRRAGHCLSRGNLALADLICQSVLDSIPDHAPALSIAGLIAEQLGLPAQAAAYFKQALARDPSLDYVRDRLATSASKPAAPHPAKAGRYLLIKAWGFGFWSDVGHVLGAALLAELTWRTPVTHWGGNSHFADGSGGDAFRLYFEPISPLTSDALLAMRGADIFPPKWSLAELAGDEKAKTAGPDARMAGIYFLNRPEAIAVSDFYVGVGELLPWIPRSHRLHGKGIDQLHRYLIDKYLRPQRAIVAEIDGWYRAHIAGAPTIAVHVRGSDKQREADNLAEINARYFAALDREDPTWKILLLTEDSRWVEIFSQRYGDRLVVTESQRVGDDSNIHLAADIDGYRLGIEVMRNTYLALRCEKFLGNGLSNVSAMIALLKPWKKGACQLVEPSILHRRNFYLHEDGTEPWIQMPDAGAPAAT
jgi:protein O-GlcNAc transferase